MAIAFIKDGDGPYCRHHRVVLLIQCTHIVFPDSSHGEKNQGAGNAESFDSGGKLGAGYPHEAVAGCETIRGVSLFNNVQQNVYHLSACGGNRVPL
jgi:hypothetical protein